MYIQDSVLNAQIDELLKIKEQHKDQLTSETEEKRRASNFVDRFDEKIPNIDNNRVKRQKMFDRILIKNTSTKCTFKTVY